METITNLPLNQYKSHHLEIDDQLMETNNPCLWITGILIHVLYNGKKKLMTWLKVLYTIFHNIDGAGNSLWKICKFNHDECKQNWIKMSELFKDSFGILCKKNSIKISFRNF